MSRDFRYFVNEDVTSKLVNSIKRSPDANTAFLANKIKDGMGKTSKTFTATRDFHLVSIMHTFDYLKYTKSIFCLLTFNMLHGNIYLNIL